MAYDEKTNIEPRHISKLVILLNISLNVAVSKKNPTIKEDRLTTPQKEVI